MENEKHFESKDNHYYNYYIAEYLWITEDIEDCVYYCRDPSTFKAWFLTSELSNLEELHMSGSREPNHHNN